MFVVTSSVGMVNWVHAHTFNIREHLSFGFAFPVEVSCFEDGLFVSTSSSDNSYGCSALGVDGFSDTARKFDSGFLTIFALGNDSGESSRPLGEFSFVSSALFDIADQSTFGDQSDRNDVSNVNGGFLSAVNELTSVESFNGNEKLFDGLVGVRVLELDSGERGTSTRVVDDFSHDSFHVTFLFGIIDGSVLRRCLSVEGLSFKD